MTESSHIERLVAVMRDIERDLSSEHGPFQLFALFLPEEAEGFWDIVVAAPWLRPYDKASYSIVANEVQSRVDPDDITFVSRIAVIDSGSESLTSIAGRFAVEHGLVTVTDTFFFGRMIRQAFIITARNLPSPAESVAA